MKRITLVCGHYGSGKTNFSLNLALNAAKRGERITLVDLDIVNPYFRTADYKDELEAAGVNVIIDVGGDDAGATALGRFSRQLNESGYDMLCVINKYRKFISDPEEAVEMLAEIEAACRLKATGIVNNSHLGAQTTAQDILASVPYAEKTAELASLPLVCTTAPKSVASELEGKIENLCPVDVLVKLPW